MVCLECGYRSSEDYEFRATEDSDTECPSCGGELCVSE